MCKDQIWISNPTHGWTKAQKDQNNEFIESGLENWALVSRTNHGMSSDDNITKRKKGLFWRKSSSAESKKVGSCILFLCLVTNLVPECYSAFVFFLDLLSCSLSLLLYCLSLWSSPSTCMPNNRSWYLSH